MDERRSYQRQPASFPVEVACLDQAEKRKTEYLHNISDGGISFRTDDGERYKIDQHIVVSIKDDDLNSALISANAKVIWIDHPAYDLNTATVGVHFEKVIESVKLLDK